MVMKMKKIKLFSLACVLLLASCASFKSADWVDSSEWLADKGIAFVEISLEGRDSATISIKNNASSYEPQIKLKKGTHLYAVALDEGTCVFRYLKYDYESYFSKVVDKIRPLNSAQSKDRGGFEYCSYWNVKKGGASALGKMNFYVIENDDFYVRCDLRDSTQQAVLEKATELYPQTFDAVKKN